MAIPIYTFRYDIGSLFSDDPLVGHEIGIINFAQGDRP